MYVCVRTRASEFNPRPSIHPSTHPPHACILNLTLRTSIFLLRGFRFTVLPPGAFLIHFPHAPSKSKKSWLAGNSNNNGGDDKKQEQRQHSHRERMDALYDHFLSWALQERAARAGETVRLCPPTPPPREKKQEEEGDVGRDDAKAALTSVA